MSIACTAPWFASKAARGSPRRRRCGARSSSLEGMISAGDVAIDTIAEDRLLDVTSAQTALKYEGYLTRQDTGRDQGAGR